MISVPAIAAIILGDVLALDPTLVLDEALQKRVTALVSGASETYVAPELLALGRSGWGWVDLDPLPILARVCPGLDPLPLASVDLEARAELAAKELTSDIKSEVPAHIVMAIGVGALSSETASTLLEGLRTSLRPEEIAAQPTLGGLRAEAALAALVVGQTKATRDRLAQVAALLAQTHKGRQLIARGDRSDPAEEHFHALVEAAWALASTSESSSTERLETFASLAATLCSTWKQGRHLLNALLGQVAGAAPMAVLKRIQPDLEMIRKC